MRCIPRFYATGVFALARLGVVLLALGLADSTHATTVPTGFVHEMLIGEPFTQSPIAFDFLPDGRFVVVERASGIIRIAAAGVDSSDAVFTIPNVEAVHPERGLLGVAVDPDWPSRPYFYFNYTDTDATTKVVMYETGGALGDASSTALTLSNRFVLLDDIPDQNGIHNAGTLRFAPDGALLVSVGDDQRSCLPQDIESPLGKILRLDVSGMPQAGPGPPTIAELTPTGNPFPGSQDYGPLVLAWGLRNPFRFTVDGVTGETFIGSVGSNFFEEINLIPSPPFTGPNFGWPQWEGPQMILCCGTCGQGNPFTDAIFVLPHPLGVISIVAGPKLHHVPASAISFPASHDGDVLFAEIFTGDLYRIRDTAGTWNLAPQLPGAPPDLWGDGFVGAGDLQLGADGAVYVLSIGLNFNQLPRGLHRLRADTTMVGVPSITAAPSPGLAIEPNPARPGDGARLRYYAPVSGPARIRVYDLHGRLVRRLSDGHHAPGNRTFFLDARRDDGAPLGAGVFFVSVTTPDGTEHTAKLTRIR